MKSSIARLLLATMLTATALPAAANEPEPQSGTHSFIPAYESIFPTAADPEEVRQAEAESNHSVVLVSILPVEVDSDLFVRKYTGFEVKVMNQGPHPVEITSIQIGNGVDGKTAFEDVKRSLVSPASFLGITAIVGNTVKRANANSKAREASSDFSNTLPAGTLPTNHTFSTLTLIPFGKMPEVKVQFAKPHAVELFYSGFVAVRPVEAKLLADPPQ